MSETSVVYTVDDPGDETLPIRIPFTRDPSDETTWTLRLRRCVHCGGVVVLDRAHTCRPAVRPPYEELAAAITRFAAADKEYSAPQEVLMDQAAWLVIVAEMHALARRLPRPADPFPEQEVNGELR